MLMHVEHGLPETYSAYLLWVRVPRPGISSALLSVSHVGLIILFEHRANGPHAQNTLCLRLCCRSNPCFTAVFVLADGQGIDPLELAETCGFR